MPTCAPLNVAAMSQGKLQAECMLRTDFYYVVASLSFPIVTNKMGRALIVGRDRTTVHLPAGKHGNMEAGAMQ